MKKLLLILSLVVASSVFGQNCNYEVKKVDEFTKNSILQTKTETLSKSFSTYVSVAFQKVNNSKYLLVFIENTKLFSVDETKELLLLTSTDEVIKLNFSKYDIANLKHNSTTGLTTYTISQALSISDENFEKLKNTTIAKIRIQTIDGNIDTEVKDKWWKKVNLLLACIN